MKNSLFILFFFVCTVLHSTSSYYTYSISDGLSNSTIKAIYQDKMGYMWFGTKDGINRFDGNEIRTYRSDVQQRNAVFNNDITFIAGDENGYMWIGSFNGIELFDPYTEEFLSLDTYFPGQTMPTGIVSGIYVESSSKVWISTKNGLYFLDKNAGVVSCILENVYINRMNKCAEGFIMAEVLGKGFTLIDLRTHEVSYLEKDGANKRNPVNDIFMDSKGRVWLGADLYNFFVYDHHSRQIIPVKIKIPSGIYSDSGQIHTIIEYNDTTLVLGTDNGLLPFNTNNMVFCSNSDGFLADRLLYHRIMSVYKDGDGAFWFGTFNKGLKYYNPNHYLFKSYDLATDKGLPVGVVGNIVENNGIIWIGHERGLSLLDMKTDKTSYFNIQSHVLQKNKDSELYYIFKERSDLFYFYLLNRGTYIFDLEKRKDCKRISIPPTSQVRSMVKDMEGNIWIAEENLSIYDPKTDEIKTDLITNEKGLTKYMLAQELLMRYNGNILIGSRTNGVLEYYYDKYIPGGYLMAHKLDIEPLANKNVNVLFEDHKHNVWIGTYSSGLYCCNIEKGEYVLYNEEKGLISNMICGVLEDERTGHIWVSTVAGVSSIHPETGKILNYSYKTGFPLQEVSVHSFFKASDGKIYVGGIDRIVSFDPSFFNAMSDTLSVHITSIKTLNTKADPKTQQYTSTAALKNVHFSYSQSSIVIKFSTQNYIYPKENKYMFKLEGFDNNWNYTDRPEVTYSNLPDGEYTFLVKACNIDGVWSPIVTELDFVIHPPFWRTIWAKIFYFFVAFALLLFIIKYIINRKTYKYKQQIAQIEKDNIEKYYQLKLDLFTKFSHELRTPLTLIISPVNDLMNDKFLPERLQYIVRTIYKNSKRLLLLVNQLLDFRKIEHGAMKLSISKVPVESFIWEQIENFRELSSKKQITIYYENLYKEDDVWFDIEMMEKVISNLLSNAIKYTGECGQISIRSYELNEFFYFMISDNGEGISEEDIHHIFEPFYQVHQGTHGGMFGSGIGLSLVQYIVKLHGGNIWVESEKGKGTTFYISLFLGKEHYVENNSEIVEGNFRDVASYPIKEETLFDEEEVLPDSSLSDRSKSWVLVVEDDADLRLYIKSQLEKDFFILEAVDGKEGYAIALEQLPNLIISDVMMPNMSGIEMCDKIKDDIRTAHIPVILLTAKVMNEHIEEGYEHKADDYILKPFDAHLLNVRVKNIIQNRERLRQLFTTRLLTPGVSEEDEVVSQDDLFMQKLMDLVEKNISNPDFSIDEICQNLGMSRAQFFRKTKAISNSTPNKLILQLRMKMAVKLLLKNKLSISEVAYKVGFSDPAYFSKTFKSVYNISPTDFLKNRHVDKGI